MDQSDSKQIFEKLMNKWCIGHTPSQISWFALKPRMISLCCHFKPQICIIYHKTGLENTESIYYRDAVGKIQSSSESELELSWTYHGHVIMSERCFKFLNDAVVLTTVIMNLLGCIRGWI